MGGKAGGPRGGVWSRTDQGLGNILGTCLRGLIPLLFIHSSIFLIELGAQEPNKISSCLNIYTIAGY